MAGLDSSTIEEKGASPRHGLGRHQLRAAALPHLPLKELAGEDSSGNFQDFESLLEELGRPAILELGKPLPNEKYLPTHGLGSCPAAHNRALFDEGQD